MSELKHVSSSPHIRSKITTSNIMLLVIFALMPATLFGVWNFGISALMNIVVCVGVSVGAEFIYEKLMHKKVTVNDYSAALTGLLLALNLPPNATWWMSAIGSLFAIIVVKQLFGGLGQNFMNPALAARCFLLIAFTGRMTDFTYDSVSTATPLALLKNGESVNILDMVIGKTAGTIGETSAVLLLAGAAVLIVLGVIDLRIPASYIISFVVFIVIFGGHGFDLNYIVAHLSGGGLMLGAFFMATDYVTSPITSKGQIVYGILLGILTGIFRLFGGSAEGVSYAIIFCNLLVPLIERVTMPKPFGPDEKEVQA